MLELGTEPEGTGRCLFSVDEVQGCSQMDDIGARFGDGRVSGYPTV